jgi:hypothetical protein
MAQKVWPRRSLLEKVVDALRIITTDQKMAVKYEMQGNKEVTITADCEGVPYADELYVVVAQRGRYLLSLDIDGHEVMEFLGTSVPKVTEILWQDYISPLAWPVEQVELARKELAELALELEVKEAE